MCFIPIDNYIAPISSLPWSTVLIQHDFGNRKNVDRNSYCVWKSHALMEIDIDSQSQNYGEENRSLIFQKY